MGLLLTSVGNVLVTSIAVGALKRQGAITIHPEKIKNDALRSVVVTAVDVGENISLRVENLWHDLSSSSSPK